MNYSNIQDQVGYSVGVEQLSWVRQQGGTGAVLSKNVTGQEIAGDVSWQADMGK